MEELGTDRLMIDNFGASNFEDQFIEDFNNTFGEESSPCPLGVMEEAVVKVLALI